MTLGHTRIARAVLRGNEQTCFNTAICGTIATP
jgi:hypothetical protein